MPESKASTLTAHLGNAVNIYPTLEPGYTLIVSDGAYGIGGFPGDPKSPKALADWYAPHLEAWDRLAAPSSSLYFWCTPEGCSRMLPHVEADGWRLFAQLRWNKGPSLLTAYHAVPETFRGWRSVSEDCYFYVREAHAAAEWAGDGYAHKSVSDVAGASNENSVRAFIRSEWMVRAGLPVAVFRGPGAWMHTGAERFFTRAQWSFPTWENFRELAAVAEARSAVSGRPLFVVEEVYLRGGGLRSSWEALRASWRDLLDHYQQHKQEIEALRYPFTLPQGVTDVWTGLPVNRTGRHSCAKRDDHIERIVTASSRQGDRVLEPFGGGAPVLRACRKLGRSCDSIEVDPEWHARALASIETRPESTATREQPSLFA